MIPHDASPGDIFADAQGKLWRVQGVWHDPVVIMEEVEGTLYDPNAPPKQFGITLPTGVTSLAAVTLRAEIKKAVKQGGIGGMMWEGFTRIWRRPAPEQKDQAA